MTKLELFENVTQEVTMLLEGTKVSKAVREELQSILDKYLAPKNGGGSQNPSYTNEEGTWHYCRFHQQYELEKDMVMSKGKSKGYCKASISKWNKTNAKIKKLESEITGLVIKGEECTGLAVEVQELKANLNDPSFYDYDTDWENFTK